MTATITRPVNDIEPPPAPAAGPDRPRRSPLRILRTILVLVVLLAVAGAGGRHLVGQRLAARHLVDLGDAVLSAAPVTVGSAEAGIVTALLVADQTRVTARQDLAKVTITNTDTTRDAEVRVIKAPIAGTVTAVNAAVGGVVRAGEPMLTLYDPARLTFHVDVGTDELRKLRVGMKASVTGTGLDTPAAATLDHVVPRVGGSPATDRLTIVLVPDPAYAAAVSRLVPGLRFHTVVDTRTATGAVPMVNSA